MAGDFRYYHLLTRVILWSGVSVACLLGNPLRAEQLIRLRSGLAIRGSVIPLASLTQNPFVNGAEVQVLPISMVDDGLRRTYIYTRGMVAEANSVESLKETVKLWQPAPLGGKSVSGLGSVFAISPFNEFGRRIITVRGPDGDSLSILQGISEINARYAKVEGLKSSPAYIWDMRIATDSIPADQLQRIFGRRKNDYEERLEVVRFYIEGQRIGEARKVLETAIRDFPNEPRLTTQLQVLVQLQGKQLLDEAKFRRDAGQYQLAMDILKNFPLPEVARVTRLEVQDTIETMEGRMNEGRRMVEQLRAQIGERVDDRVKTTLTSIADEIAQSLSLDTIARLSDYSRLGGVENSSTDSRIALAVGGWLMGSGSGLSNIDVAVSLIEVRSLVYQYLQSGDEPTRKAILAKLRGMEGARAEYVELMLPLLPPPFALPEEAKHATIAGMYQIDQKVTGHEFGDYLIQLPPEYNPLRSYPCIVALHPIDGTAESQLDYWSGTPAKDGASRNGQGARHGFVVVAPKWSRPGQSYYESTPREHAEVLTALRDAMRRVSIDSDRVFINGLGAGGSAAWDIAVSHPDLWAGMISISGEPGNYVRRYGNNATGLPMYMVFGELAGSPAPLVKHGDVLNDYMAPDYDAMVVMYRGRGFEHFYEEIHPLFDWMRLATHRRQNPPQKIEAATMRNGDQFFWWLELPELMEKVPVDPFLWDQSEHGRAAAIVASVGESNSVRVTQGPADRFIVHLSPKMGLQLDKPITVRYHNRTSTVNFDGSVDVMLEDARSRAERKRPYWATVKIP